MVQKQVEHCIDDLLSKSSLLRSRLTELYEGDLDRHEGRLDSS